MRDYSYSDLRPLVANALILADDLRDLTPDSMPAVPSSAKSHEKDREETAEEFKLRLTHLLGQMMFVSGETAEPGPETTWMIEEIVREQVIEMVRASSSDLRLV